MLRVFTDFNARCVDGNCWILIYNGVPIDGTLVKIGDKIIILQDEDDFEVVAKVDFRFVESLGRYDWVAIPDWSTKRIINKHGNI